MSRPTTSKMGLNATWSMAVGGMVGGGIFSTLGVVIGIAGPWAWLSFAAAGGVALCPSYSYVRLADYCGEGGGAFTFLREIHRDGFAGSLSWVLIVGYVLTNAVYAFTRALQVGEASRVAPVDKLSVVLVAVFGVPFLGERLAPRDWVGLVAFGAVLLAWPR